MISKSNDTIAITNFLSSWYWYRKEHQTRLELFFRGLQPLSHYPDGINSPSGEMSPNVLAGLFRYDNKNVIVEKLLSSGSIRFRLASKFSKMEGDKARMDDECRKITRSASKGISVTTEFGTNIPIIGYLKYVHMSQDCYIFCLSTAWQRRMHEEFSSDSCLHIYDKDKFIDIIRSASQIQFGRGHFDCYDVQYFDPFENDVAGKIDPYLYKDFRFAYQKEYRLVWHPHDGNVQNEFRTLSVNGINSVAHLIDF
jgi:hypothetical protein